MRVLIKPAANFTPGMVQRILGDLNAGPIITDPSTGFVTAELSQGQIDAFRLKGGMHYIEVILPPAPVPVVEPAPAVEEPNIHLAAIPKAEASEGDESDAKPRARRAKGEL